MMIDLLVAHDLEELEEKPRTKCLESLGCYSFHMDSAQSVLRWSGGSTLVTESLLVYCCLGDTHWGYFSLAVGKEAVLPFLFPILLNFFSYFWSWLVAIDKAWLILCGFLSND